MDTSPRIAGLVEKRLVDVHGTDFAEKLWKESWTYIKTVVDTVREPFIILDQELRVMVANERFYDTFHVAQKETEGKSVFNLGNGQWDIPSLRTLLENILPKDTFFKGYEVVHEFPIIGKKIMILNARRVYRNDTADFPPIILLAMEDVTDVMSVAEKLANQASQLEVEMNERTRLLESHITRLGKEIKDLTHDRV
jgi:nitrogen-specific signal transduction histidine kinase